jgi:hypothetical protein
LGEHVKTPESEDIMKNIIKTERTLSLRTHSIRDLTAEDLRLAVGGRSGSGSGSGSGSSGGSAGGHVGSYGGGAMSS